jgi:hypothetical protein
MIFHKPHKKLYYTSGLISLLLLPILCVFYLQSQRIFKPIISIEYKELFHKGDIYLRTEESKAYKTYCLSGKEVYDKNILKLVHKQIHELVTKKDEKNGILVRFSGKTKLWSFIEVLNICYKEDIQQYEFFNDEFKLYYSSFKHDELIDKNLSSEYEICGTARISNMMLIKEVLEKNQVLRQQKETPKSLIIFYILLSGVFLAMVGIEIRRIIRYFV